MNLTVGSWVKDLWMWPNGEMKTRIPSFHCFQSHTELHFIVYIKTKTDKTFIKDHSCHQTQRWWKHLGNRQEQNDTVIKAAWTFCATIIPSPYPGIKLLWIKAVRCNAFSYFYLWKTKIYISKTKWRAKIIFQKMESFCSKYKHFL